DRPAQPVAHRHSRHHRNEFPLRWLHRVAGRNSASPHPPPRVPPTQRRRTGALLCDRNGVTTPYALYNLQERGELFVGPTIDVYEGMIVGENAKDNDLEVKQVRAMKLTNMRSSTSDMAIRLVPFRNLNLEQAIEFITDDEYVEVTPKSLRLRKKILQANRRPRKGLPVEAEH